LSLFYISIPKHPQQPPLHHTILGLPNLEDINMYRSLILIIVSQNTIRNKCVISTLENKPYPTPNQFHFTLLSHWTVDLLVSRV